MSTDFSPPDRVQIDPSQITFDDEGRVVINDPEYAAIVREALDVIADEARRVVKPNISIPIVDVWCDKNRNCPC